jgi:predicted ATPase
MIKRLWIKNYRSLADVSLELEPLTVLVGYNGAGKSNLIDALRFVSDALKMGLYVAINKRGGIQGLRYWHAEPPGEAIEIGLEVGLENLQATYSFTVADYGQNNYHISHEVCAFGQLGAEAKDTWFETQQGQWVRKPDHADPVIEPGSLLLPIIAATTLQGTKLFRFLTDMGFYNIFPHDLIEPQAPTRPHPLDEQGGNLISALRYMESIGGEPLTRLETALKVAVPDVTGFLTFQVGNYLVAQLNHDQGIGSTELPFESDGTLRILAILLALYQDPPRSLLTFEEPELFIHPGAMAALWEEFEDRVDFSQIILTTHSPDLLDMCDAEQLRVVEKIKGVTYIGSLEEPQKRIIQKRLATAGQLLQEEGLHRNVEPAVTV